MHRLNSTIFRLLSTLLLYQLRHNWQFIACTFCSTTIYTKGHSIHFLKTILQREREINKHRAQAGIVSEDD